MFSSRTLAVVAASLALLTHSVAFAAPCTESEIASMDAIIKPVEIMLVLCKTDTDFTYYPFSSFPTDDQQRFVCNGRSCPAVFNQLQGATLPKCTVTVDGQAITPDEFIQQICAVRGTKSPPVDTSGSRAIEATTTVTVGDDEVAPGSVSLPEETTTTPSPAVTSSTRVLRSTRGRGGIVAPRPVI